MKLLKFKELIDNDKLEFTDAYKIKLPDELTSVDKSTRNKLKDEFISGKRDLLITLPFSNSDRMINRRIYPQKGQKSGVDTWTNPFKRPVQVHHDDYRDPIGRVQKVWWQPRDYVSDFKDLRSYNDFKSKIESGNHELIYSALLDYKKLANPKWFGTGFLMGDISITDQGAIEKFIDERYLTFSSGHVSDAWICSHCGKDRMKDEWCEHYPGQVIDNKPVVAILGTFIGREISPVNKPANDVSFPVAMKFADSLDTSEYIELTNNQIDTIDYEEEPLMKLKIIKDEEDVQTIEFPDDYLTKDSVKALLDESLNAFTDEMIRSLDTKLKSLTDILESITVPVKKEEDKEIVVEFINDESIDWAVLDLALDAEVSSKNTEAKLSVDIRKDLDANVFCSADKLFPIASQEYSDAAKSLIARSKLTDEQKKIVTACIDLKTERLSKVSVAVDAETDKMKSDLSDMTRNYEQALSEIDNLKEELRNVKDLLDSKQERNQNIEKEKVEDPQTAGAVDEATLTKKINSTFITKVVNEYKQKTELDKDSASAYVNNLIRKGYLPSKFDINDYLN